MQRIMTAVALAALAASPVAAQWAGMPVWNSPKGGTGIIISGDYASINADGGGGSAFGARAAVGLANLTLTAGLASWDSDRQADKVTSFGGTVAFRAVGGSLLPIAVNLQVGVGRSGDIATPLDTAGQTTITGAVGVAVSVPTPGMSLEPYVSAGLRNRSRPTKDTNFGWTIGANAKFGLVGVHLAYDSETLASGTSGIIGVGVHVGLKLGLGM